MIFVNRVSEAFDVTSLVKEDGRWLVASLAHELRHLLQNQFFSRFYVFTYLVIEEYL